MKRKNDESIQLGVWEKHTKGIGKKLLEKFGFKGRLGANEDGISQIVEVELRASGIGLGFGSEGSRTFQSKDPFDSSIANVNEQKSVKLDRTNIRQRKRKKIKVEDLSIQENDDQPSTLSMNIIDLSDPDHFSFQVGKELLFNLESLETSLYMNISKNKTSYHDLLSQFHIMKTKISLCDADLTNLMDKVNISSKFLERFEFISRTIQFMGKSIGYDSIILAFQEILSAFVDTLKSSGDEFATFGLIELLYDISDKACNAAIDDNEQLNVVLAILTGWGNFFNEIKESNFLNITHNGLISLKKWIDGSVIYKENFIQNWNYAVSAIYLKIFLLLEDFTFHDSSFRLFSEVIVVNLNNLFEMWAPNTIPVKSELADIIYPWTLSQQFDEVDILVGSIYKKIVKHISNKSLDENDLALLNCWRKVFKKKTFDELIIRLIIPKLIYSLRKSESVVQLESYNSLDSILKWINIISEPYAICLIAGELLSKWSLSVMHALSKNDSLTAIHHSYCNWRATIPLELRNASWIISYFHRVLSILDLYADGELLGSDIQATILELENKQENFFSVLKLIQP